MSSATVEPAARGGRLDPLGVVLAVTGLAGLLLPFALARANRLVAGTAESLVAALPPGAAAATLAVLAAALGLALPRTGPWLRLAAGVAGLAALALAIGLVPQHLVAEGDRLARVGPGAGFWLLVLVFAMLLADATARLSLSPAARLGLLAAAILAVAGLFASGHFDGLSILREYANRAPAFWREGAQHIRLAVGSLAAAAIVGLPLGIACARRPGLRAAVLPVLNIVQTVPSMAMYGLMMVPLALLAAHVPLAAALGIRGIGAAPALIALFLYSLLPIAANTAIGIAGVPTSVLEAADGMGMTPRQRLFRVELPLALPVILAGIRIVLVQNIGLVTIAALIGGGGFGTFVFQGIGQAATDLVLLGALPTIALAFVGAVLLDALIDALERTPPP
ncbi:ABC transporter permease [Prosthecomicrobium pneumaticum]|uniref:Osmoprotectant transport system permease protein n=1 Tax=Prosthecomicrobium pneumaticum TaxID=81895 RepID=A0A7W9FNK1_9HYPH|nr:osmoprotectant transport system permease protein [Prosthecomicrobium pneumaticum]